MEFFSAVNFFQFLVFKTLEQDWIRIRIDSQPKMLDPDPCKMNTDPKPSNRGLHKHYLGLHKHSQAIYILQTFTRPTRPCFVLLWPLQALTSTVLFCAIWGVGESVVGGGGG